MKTLIKQDLEQFHGTSQYYKHWCSANVYTDGVKYLADSAGAYWLIDAIFSYNRKEHFQIWELVKMPTTAILTMREDSKAPIKVVQEIAFTDFPLDEMELWLIDGVLILPSEY